jgi:hypothetical protein
MVEHPTVRFERSFIEPVGCLQDMLAGRSKPDQGVGGSVPLGVLVDKLRWLILILPFREIG